MNPAISAVIGDQIRDLRRREGLSRDELAAAARSAGAPENFTAAVVGFLEVGRRGFRVDELIPLAAALEVSPLELLGEHAKLFVGDDTAAGCARCGGTPGDIERTVRADIAALTDLEDLEPSLAATAYVLARAIDTPGEAKPLPALTRELRACIEQIRAGRRGRHDPDDGDDLDDLDAPDGGGPNLDDLPDD